MRSEIERVVERWSEGWRTGDAALAASGYTADAAWVNAFGMRATGRDEIQRILEHVFSLPNVMAGRGRVVAQSVERLADDCALVWTNVERTGQLTGGGEELGTRHTTHLRVVKRAGDEWLVVAHLISDARRRERPEH